MNINSEKLRKKIQELFPDRSYNLTNKALEELCDDPNSKDFLNWFCSEMSPDNVLTEEEIQLANHIKKSGEWLEDEELDNALAELTGENPDLLEILESDVNEEDLSANHSLVSMLIKSDEDYFHSLEKGIKNLKGIENRLDDQIEKEQDALEKIKIEGNLAFEESLQNIGKFDSIQRELSERVEQVVHIYSDASQKKGPLCVWTQMPLDLFTKHMETYNEYLKVYIKKEFGTLIHDLIDGEPTASTINTENDINLDFSNEKQNQENKIIELRSIHQSLIKAKFSEIIAKGRKEATQAMVNYVQQIYNGGDVQMPKTSALLRAEIAELRIKRDNLEKQVAILKEHQIPEAVERFVNSIINKVLVENAKVTQERREHSIQKLENLLTLAKNHGHVHSDLLYILIELDNQKLSEAVEFISAVRNYLEMEYSSSSKRCDSMRNAREIVSSSSFRNENFFNKYFTSMMGVDEDSNSLDRAMEKFDELLNENEEMEGKLTQMMYNYVNLIRTMDLEMMKKYNSEVQNSGGPSLELEFQIDKTERNLRGLQTDVFIIRNKLKEMMEKVGGLERENVILWQKFLAEPETVKTRYDELMEIADQNRQEIWKTSKD